MRDTELERRLMNAESLEDVEALLSDRSDIDPKRAWEEVENHRSGSAEKLDLQELDAVSGGADRDWVKDGCAATCEVGSWCWSNDQCQIWDVTYSNFWAKCPDGHEHEYNIFTVCKRCGHCGGGDFSSQ